MLRSTARAASKLTTSRSLKISSSAPRFVPRVYTKNTSSSIRSYSSQPENPAETTKETESANTPTHPKVQVTETVVGSSQHHEFKAETKRLLDIVANSLYSEKEVFVRELVSNASDALEKLRHVQLSDPQSLDAENRESPLEIHLSVDKEKGLFIVQDYGIGMDESELVKNLGTIASSGSKAFIEKMANSSSSAKDKIIGQFGVGFYSSFMVADKLQVFSKSASADAKGLCWTSDGSGSYDIAEAEGVRTGTKIVIHLKKDCMKFADDWEIENILQKYSNFIGFPIFLNGDRVNTIEPLWTKDKNSVSEEEHTQFYRFIAHAWDDPQFRLHYKTDAPLAISALLYVPERHTEFAGMGRMDSGVSLYSRKVLIKSKAQLLPDFLRFVKGVIDSEDIPLNISRELLQDGALINKLKRVMTTRVLKWLEEESKRDSEKYNKFFKDFGIFLKEGVCTDRENKDAIGKLLRYESSKSSDPTVTFKSYIENMKPEQKNIFYLVAPSRQSALDSPYYEPFEKKDIEVLFCYETVDEFVMNHLAEAHGKKLVNVEAATLEDIGAKEDEVAKSEENAEDSANANAPVLTATDKEELVAWFKEVLGSNVVADVSITKRLISSPALIVDHDSAVMRRLMQMTPGFKDNFNELTPQKLEINADHGMIRGLNAYRHTQPDVAKEVARQIFDNALIGAGLLDDPKMMLRRLNTILESLVTAQEAEKRV